MKVFEVVRPAERVPIIVSVPHCGTEIPDDIKSGMNPALLPPDDTDFFVHRLYDFITHMGITMVFANYSRWVIDLNRDPDSKPLYSDGRIITGLVPETDFLGNNIYQADLPDGNDVLYRLENFYRPYHNELSHQINLLQQQFKHVLLFDAHSIRKTVPSIHGQPFPDLILGDNDGMTAHESLINAAWTTLEDSDYSSSHNFPFKGGFITRSFGEPAKNVHGLQLEMAKINYMDDNEIAYHEERADKMRALLQELFKRLIRKLEELNT